MGPGGVLALGHKGMQYKPLSSPASVSSALGQATSIHPIWFSGLLWEKQKGRKGETSFRIMDVPGAEEVGEGRWEKLFPAVLWALPPAPLSFPPPESPQPSDLGADATSSERPSLTRLSKELVTTHCLSSCLCICLLVYLVPSLLESKLSCLLLCPQHLK